MKTVDGSINSGSRGSSRGSSDRVGGGVDLAAFELPAWRTSCKLAWLVEHLQNLREEDPSVKASSNREKTSPILTVQPTI